VGIKMKMIFGKEGSWTATPGGRMTIVALTLMGALSNARAADMEAFQPLDCMLQPYEVVEISSAVEGVIENIHVDRNDFVSEGQLLVELDDEVETTQVELASARAALKTNIDLRQAELAFNERSQDRLEQLYASNTISLHIKDEAETDTRKSRLQLKNARDAQQLARLELAKAEAILALRSMHSPIEGVVIARHKVAGEFVEDQSILRIAQLNPLKVEVIVPVEMFGQVKKGMLVEVVPEHSGRKALMAKVTMVDRVIDPASGTFDVKAELANPDYSIPSGLHCTALFSDAPAPVDNIASVEIPAAAQVPTAAVAEAPLQTGASAEATVELAVASTTINACDAQAEEAVVQYAVTAYPVDNSATASQLQERIIAAGLEDTVLMGDRQSGQYVALAVFSSKRNANRLQAQMAHASILAAVEILQKQYPSTRCEPTTQFAAVAR